MWRECSQLHTNCMNCPHCLQLSPPPTCWECLCNPVPSLLTPHALHDGVPPSAPCSWLGLLLSRACLSSFSPDENFLAPGSQAKCGGLTARGVEPRSHACEACVLSVVLCGRVTRESVGGRGRRQYEQTQQVASKPHCVTGSLDGDPVGPTPLHSHTHTHTHIPCAALCPPSPAHPHLADHCDQRTFSPPGSQAKGVGLTARGVEPRSHACEACVLSVVLCGRVTRESVGEGVAGRYVTRR
jgi:hypothetical protein